MRHTRNGTVLLMALSVLINRTVYPHAAARGDVDDAPVLETANQASAEAQEVEVDGKFGDGRGGETDDLAARSGDGNGPPDTAEAPPHDGAAGAQAKSESPLFTVTGPDGTVITWGEGDVGAVALYYDGLHDPEHRH